MTLLEQFLLRTTGQHAATIIGPIVDATDRHPKEVHWFVQGLIGVEDRKPNTSQFWSMWKLFADKMRCASWLATIDEEHPTGGEMISAIFLGSWWKDEVRHWRAWKDMQHTSMPFSRICRHAQSCSTTTFVSSTTSANNHCPKHSF